jgi:triacylglycerol lipase
MDRGTFPVQPGSIVGRTLVIACLVLLAACAGISSKELQSLGSQITPDHVDFTALEPYARRSRAAYDSEAAIRSAYPKTIRVATPGNEQVLYFIERDDAARVQYITVRGTADKKNFHEDMDIHVRDDRTTDIPVHEGFDAAAVVIYADAKPYLKTGYTTHITGHSLGGAIAALLAVYAIEDGHKVARVVTFGQPRFTTAAGVKRLDFLPLTRVVDENDMVPMLPPASVADRVHGPYEHVGPEIILLDGPRYVYLPSHDANRISVGEFWRDVGIADLSDHKMDNYLKRIAMKTGAAVQVSYNDRERYTTRPSAAKAK